MGRPENLAGFSKENAEHHAERRGIARARCQLERPMTIKDYVYLGLIALAALIFYCHGFYAGVSRSRRVYEALLDEEADEAMLEAPEAILDSTPVAAFPSRQTMPPFPRREARGDFGNN